MNNQPVYVIIPAAGSGSRMKLGHNKQFLQLGQYPVILRTLLAFEKHPEVDGFIVVASCGETAAVRSLMAGCPLAKCLGITEGGPKRQDSVANGLQALAACLAESLAQSGSLADSVILVHDGARCFVTPDIISRVIEGIRQNQACGAALPVKETIKEIDASCQVVRTLDRKQLWTMQTPQGATFRLLRKAYDRSVVEKWQVTDDLSVLELAGIRTFVVPGSELNIKLTTPEDRLLGEQLALIADQEERC